jgi:hypothetical protein
MTEATPMNETVELAEAVMGGASIYLGHGAAPLSELVRVLSQHAEAEPGRVGAILRDLIAAGQLRAHGYQVSLPAGGDTRESEGQR